METQQLAIVTGGAVRIGKAISFALARAGYAIALHYHKSHQEALDTVTELERLGVPVFPFQADLTSPEEIQLMFEQIDRVPYELSVLVNSAAVMARGNLKSMPVEEWNSVFDLNIRAAHINGQYAYHRMKNGGSIINITDTGFNKTWTGFPAYTISKSALETLTRLQAKTYAPNVRVNAIAPGLILPPEDVPQDEWKRLIDRLPLKRAGSPDAVAQTVTFLIQNEYITGTTIFVDGGYQLI